MIIIKYFYNFWALSMATYVCISTIFWLITGDFLFSVYMPVLIVLFGLFTLVFLTFLVLSIATLFIDPSQYENPEDL